MYLAAMGMALTNTFNTGTVHDGGCQGLSKRGPVPGQVDGETKHIDVTSVMYPFARALPQGESPVS
jgi:hypothetical protein